VTDFTDYIMLYTTLLSCAWLLKHDNHVRLTIVLDRVSDKNTLIMNVVNSLFCVVVCGIIVWFGLADTWDAIQHGIVIPRPVPVPKWLLVGVIPFAFILLVLGFLRSAFRCINQLKTMSGRR
jgi:C4-dicarboxylate transporter DctQ subunit